MRTLDLRSDPRAGFTLIEVLAALVVTSAFVAVVLPYAGRLATRWWIGETRVEVADGWMQATARMSDDLAQAMPYGLGSPAATGAAFRADADVVAFIRPTLGGTGGLEAVTYEIRSSAAGSSLVRRSHGFEAATFGRDIGGASATLIDGPYRFRLIEVARDGTRHRGWSPADGMPAAVELSAVTLGDGLRRDVAVPAAPVLMPIVARAPPAAKPGGKGAPQ